MSDEIKKLDVRFSKCIITEVRSSKSIIIEDIEDIFAAAATIEALRAERDRLKAALVRLRDCDWVISLPDRMDAVREIARQALEAKE